MRTVYRYRMLRFACVWLAVVTILLVGFALFLARKFGASYALRGFFVLAPGFWILGFLVVISSADVVLDENGIARLLFGHVLRQERWQNVRMITCFDVRTPFESTRAVNVFPVSKPRFHLLPSGKMSFRAEAKNDVDLIQMVSQHASAHGIPIKFLPDA